MPITNPSELVTSLKAAARHFEMHPPEEYAGVSGMIDRRQLTQRRRSGKFAVDEICGLFELRRDENDVLRWQDGFASSPSAFLAGTGSGTQRRAFRRSISDDGELVAQLQFERLKPNEISLWLDTMDKKLTPEPYGLLELDSARNVWLPASQVPASGKILLLIHGTFSSSENFLAELQATKAGQDYLKRVSSGRSYSGVFAFQHPTLSVSPWLNAIELARLFDGSKAAVDIIAHSRGGLVARWWADCFDRFPSRQRHGVLVGSPLAGTSLASPASIRSSLDLFTNVANALETASTLGSTMIPLLSVVAGLLKVVGSVTEAASKLPIADALIAAIPGLSGQSATSNNFELQALRRGKVQSGTRYFAVRSDFQPEPAGWKFWRYFTDPSLPAAAMANGIIFRQANDLIVDVDHMSSLSDGQGNGAVLPTGDVLDLAANATVWHCNYFRNDQVLQWIDGTLRRPLSKKAARGTISNKSRPGAKLRVDG